MPAIAVTGFFGKLPSRGDFLRVGLPGPFIAAWDAWLSSVLPHAQAALGARWTPAWMEAPVWRFHLPAGQSGPEPVLGLWMPSVDSAGRHFPLTLATLTAVRSDPWLDAVEDCGRAALDAGLAPDALTACLPSLAASQPQQGAGPTEAAWWTEGAPMVPPASFTLGALPDAERFTAMLAGPPMLARPGA